MPAAITRRTTIARVLLVIYLVAVAFIVFAPSDDATKVTGIVALVAKTLGTVGLGFEPTYVVLEFVANIALFVPFGILVRLVWKRPPWWMILALGFLTTVAIELTQLALPTRYSTLSDVIANTLGTAVGLLLVQLVTRRLRE
jgi:glycopeptide antibiotics resistance protein